MDLLSNLDAKHWENKGGPPEDLRAIGYEYYHVFRRDGPHPDKTIKYFLQNEDGLPIHAVLKHLASKHDPLKNVANVHMKLGEGKEVVGMILEDDWVERIN